MKELYNYINDLIYKNREIEVDAAFLKNHIDTAGANELLKICGYVIDTYDDIDKIAEIIW